MATSSSKIQGIIIEIGGDTSKLQQALKTVDTQLNQTTGKLKDVEKLLKLDPSNINLLSQKFGYLSKAIAESQDKLKILKEVQEKLKSAGIDEESEQYKELQRAIEATNIKLKQLANSKEELINKVKELGGDVGELTEDEKNLTKQTDKLTAANKKSEKPLNAAAQNLKNYIVIAEKVIKAISKIVTAIYNLASEAADSAKQIEKLSKQTSLSTDEIQELSYIADKCGVSLDIITKTVKQNILAIKEASKLNWDYMEAYDALGISIYDTDGVLKDSGDIYWEVIEALRNMEESTQRDIIAEQLLGRKATDLNEIFALSNEEFSSLVEEAHEIGYVLDSETIASLASLDNQLVKAESSLAATKNLIAAQFAPAMSEASNAVAQFITDVNKIIDGDQTLDNFLESMGTKFTEGLTNLLNGFISNLPQILSGVVKSLSTLVVSLADTLADLDWYGLIFGLVESIADIALNLLPDLFTRIVQSAGQLLSNLIGDLFTGEFWVKIGKMGANIGISIVNGLMATIENGINTMLSGISNLLKVFKIDLGSVSLPRIPMLAKGGVLTSGSAIVGERGAELLTNVNGKSVVQPLSSQNKNPLSQPQIQPQQQIISINFTGSLSQLAKILEPEITRERNRIGTTILG